MKLLMGLVSMEMVILGETSFIEEACRKQSFWNNKVYCSTLVEADPNTVLNRTINTLNFLSDLTDST